MCLQSARLERLRVRRTQVMRRTRDIEFMGSKSEKLPSNAQLVYIGIHRYQCTQPYSRTDLTIAQKKYFQRSSKTKHLDDA